MSVVVIGAGVFGSFTALKLLERGETVTLVDAWGPGHSRASSGGESRVIRATYGDDAIYTRWVVRALEQWKAYEERWGTTLYHRTGGLWLVGDDDASERAAVPHLRDAGVRFEELTAEEAGRRFPQIHVEDVRWAIYEHDVGYLLARRACQAARQALVAAGGRYVQQEARLASDGRSVTLSGGESLEADAFVFACGPWLGALFPEVGKDWIVPTRQEIYYFGTAAGDRRYVEGECPIWIDNGARLYYGIPGNEWRGFKIADDSAGPRVDPTTMDRLPTPEGIDAARDYLAHRFPGMKDAPLVDARVCQYENSADHHFVVDRHPDHNRVWLVGGGSGHGFKHGPVLGEHVAGSVLGAIEPEPMFRLARFAGRATG